MVRRYHWTVGTSLFNSRKEMDDILIKHPKVQTQGRNIRHYTNYLTERARAYRETRCDFVRGAENRLEKMSIDKGLLRETETIQRQITALLKCDVSYRQNLP